MWGFIVLVVARCFVVGSKEVINISALTKFKKLFAYFCIAFSGMTVFVVSVVLMNIYVDMKVPVSLGFKSSVSVLDDYVTAEGTWTSSNLFENGSNIYLPQQTSKIVCNRDIKQCIESRAMISTSGNTPSLITEVIQYDIASWGKFAIVYFKSNLCFDEIYTIDLNSKTVNGTEKYSPNVPNKSYCKPPDKNYKEVVYKLDDGYSVYSKLRREASPYLLKIVYSLFGN